MLPSLSVSIHLKLNIFYRRSSKDAALEKFKLAMSSPITPSSSRLSHSYPTALMLKCGLILKRIYQPFENLSDRQKKARAQAKSDGPGVPIEKIPLHRIRKQQCQLDHFLEFTMRPYYCQDIAHGTRTIKLENGEEFVIPNVVRTMAK